MIVAALTPFFLSTYGSWKSMIPDLQPFGWDAWISNLDRVLHLGRLPHEWLQPVLGQAPVTRTIDVLYILWLPVNGAVIVWQGWSTRLGLRAQFFVTYFLVYILLGTALATALSAGGPCYYGALVGPQNPYAPLMNYLGRLSAEQPIIALRVQETLWRNYTEGLNLPVRRHLGDAQCARGSRSALRDSWLAHVSLAGLGIHGLRDGHSGGDPVHLGWHYAADGYVSVLLVPVLWVVTGHLLHNRAYWLLRSRE